MTSKVEKRNLSFLVSNNNHKIKWWQLTFSKWEDETFVVFDKLLSKNKIFIDLGAWIGTTCLYASLLSKHVYAVEADPVSLADLQDNIEVNKFNNITVINQPIYDKITDLYFGPYQSDNDWNTSSSMIKKVSDNKLDIVLKAITFEKLIKDHRISNISLIKIDIEGGEENIIPNVFEYLHNLNQKPAVYLSFHYDWWSDKSNLEKFSKYWSIYTFAYYQLKRVDTKSINEIVKSDPFGSVLFTNDKIDF